MKVQSNACKNHQVILVVGSCSIVEALKKSIRVWWVPKNTANRDDHDTSSMESAVKNINKNHLKIEGKI